jgi:hypothetical protein
LKNLFFQKIILARMTLSVHHKFMSTSTRSSKALALATVSILGFLGSARANVINITVDDTGALRNGVGVANSSEYGLANNNPTSNLTFLNAEISLYNTAYDPDLPVGIAPVGASFENLNAQSYSTISGWDYVVIHFGAGQAQFAEAPAWIPTVVVPPIPAVYYTAAEVAAWNAQKKNKNHQISTSTIKTPGVAGYTIPGHFEATDWEKSQGGWWQAYYIGGLAGINFTVPTPGPVYEDFVYNGLPVGGFSSVRYFNEHHEPPPPVPEGGATIALLGVGMLVTALSGRRLLSNRR